MKLKAIIIDDEPLARKLLSDFSEKIPFLEILGSFSNGLEALEFLKQHSPDLIFLDIQMPDITGLELLRVMRDQPQVIFTTAYAEYAVEGFELDATDYLLKPFDFPRFLKAVTKAFEKLPGQSQSESKEAEDTDFLFVKDGRELVKVRLSDIRYIKGQKDYVQFHTSNGKLMSLMKMRDLEQDLPSKGFLRIHQSFIVNTSHIEAIANDKVLIADEYLPVSQSYRQSFKAFLSKYGH